MDAYLFEGEKYISVTAKIDSLKKEVEIKENQLKEFRETKDQIEEKVKDKFRVFEKLKENVKGVICKECEYIADNKMQRNLRNMSLSVQEKEREIEKLQDENKRLERELRLYRVENKVSKEGVV
jgi:chromosome segregation ATPase